MLAALVLPCPALQATLHSHADQAVHDPSSDLQCCSVDGVPSWHPPSVVHFCRLAAAWGLAAIAVLVRG